jgi:predicted oxidoreductase
MKTFTLPGTDMVVPNVVLGLMRIQDKTDEEVRTLVSTARDAGITFLDHADVYGSSKHGCERRFAEALKLTSSEREQFIIQSKAGIVRDGPYFDFSYQHIIESVNGSLQALGTDYLDILLLHRPDALVEPEEVARAFDELHAAGRCARSASRTRPPPDRPAAQARHPADRRQPAAAVNHTLR